MEAINQDGNWNIDTFRKLQQESAPRDKWAKILMRTKGNIHGVKMQPRRYPHLPQGKFRAKVKDRGGETEKRQEQEEEATTKTRGRDAQQERQQTQQTEAGGETTKNRPTTGEDDAAKTNTTKTNTERRSKDRNRRTRAENNSKGPTCMDLNNASGGGVGWGEGIRLQQDAGR